MAMRAKKGKLRKGAEMAHAAALIQTELQRVRAKLAEAEWLIREMEKHEGAEGWSQYLRERLDKYSCDTELT